MIWRLLFAIFLAGTSLALRAVSEQTIPASGLILSLLVLFLSLGLTQIGIRLELPRRNLLAFQVGADTFCIAAVVHLFGPYSAFPLLFCLPILFSAYYLGRRAAMVLASVAAVFTGGGQVGVAMGWLFSGASAGMDAALGQPVLVTNSPSSGMVRMGLESGEFLGIGEILDDGRVAPRRLIADQ